MERQEGAFELWQTPHAPYWIPKGNWHAMPTIIAEEESGFYAHSGRVCRPGDVVIDCGAHVGVYTRQALRDGASLVVAVEPAPRNLECLRRNLAAEIASGGVIVCPKGVWNKEDVLPLYEDPEHTAADGFVAPGAKHRAAQQIPLTTIDQIAVELHLPRVNVIKMDIKGATARALKGARLTLAQHRPWLSLSTEEEEDDPNALTQAVHVLAPNYQPECGICSLASKWTVRPDAMLFY
jgi:FkbM family methyltransferase